MFIGSADTEGRADVTPRGGPAGFVSVLDERTLVIPDATGNKRLDTPAQRAADRTPRPALPHPRAARPRCASMAAPASRRAPNCSPSSPPSANPPVTALVVHVEQVYPHCPKSLMRANAWQPERWVPADAQRPAPR
ncbi:hypothetical protein GCM10017687_24060 [Streptomyces echinatus]